MSGKFSEKGKTEEEIKEIRKKKGKSSRSRGAEAERQLASIFRDYGFDKAERTAQRCGKNGGVADIRNVPYLHIESKYVEKLNLDKAMEQSIRDLEQGNMLSVPIVCHKKPRQNWQVTLELTDFLQMYRRLSDEDKLEVARIRKECK